MYQILPNHSPESEEQMFDEVEGLILMDSADGSLWIVKNGFREEYQGLLTNCYEVEHRNILKIPRRYK